LTPPNAQNDLRAPAQLFAALPGAIVIRAGLRAVRANAKPGLFRRAQPASPPNMRARSELVNRGFSRRSARYDVSELRTSSRGERKARDVGQVSAAS
jgi:hypothetical protein